MYAWHRLRARYVYGHKSASNLWKTDKAPFFNFNTENFHPSISEKLLTDAVSYAKSLIDITKAEYSIIMHSRKILLFQNSEPWVKKDGNEGFDIPMGCYDGILIWEQVSSFILNQLGSLIDKNSYDAWFLRYGMRQTGLFVILDHFCPFTTQKIKILIKWKKNLEIL